MMPSARPLGSHVVFRLVVCAFVAVMIVRFENTAFAFEPIQNGSVASGQQGKSQRADSPASPDSLQARILAAARNQGAAAARKLFNSASTDEQRSLKENDLINAGYGLLSRNKVETTIELFKIATEVFPNSANAYDSLAEAYLQNGEKAQAIRNYEKSIRQNPANGPARAIVWRLKTDVRRNPQNARAKGRGNGSSNASNRISSIEKLSADLDKAVRLAMKVNDLPGAAIVVVQDGKTVIKRGYGLANVEEKTPVDPDKTVFRIGSISKALTLLTLTRLADDGRIALNDDVTKYFGPIGNPNGLRDPITIQNLLTHTTGLDQVGFDRQVRDFELSLEERKAIRPGIAQFLKAGNLRRISAPGEYYRYDTYGTTLAGAVIERVTGKRFAEAMQTEMFAQLGMLRTSVEVDAQHIADLATGYERIGERNAAQPYEIYTTTPASSIDSTVADMGRLLEALTGSGANQHGRLFQPATAKAVLAPQFRPHPEFPGTTHGLHESMDASGSFEVAVRSVEHGGTMAGFKTLMVVLPHYNVGVFVVANRSGRGRNPLAAAVMKTVVENLPNVPQRQPFPIPVRYRGKSLAQYAGTYGYAMYCHSCTPAEFARGGWAPSAPVVITQQEGALLIRDDLYLPRGGDVFVRSDGRRMVYFGRNTSNQISFFAYSSSNDAFERVPE